MQCASEEERALVFGERPAPLSQQLRDALQLTRENVLAQGCRYEPPCSNYTLFARAQSFNQDRKSVQYKSLLEALARAFDLPEASIDSAVSDIETKLARDHTTRRPTTKNAEAKRSEKRKQHAYSEIVRLADFDE